MKRELSRVERAARARAAGDVDYRRAIHDARAAGATLDAIGRAAGITKQGVRKILSRDP